MSLVSCFLSLVSCLLSLVSCLLSLVSCLLSLSPCLSPCFSPCFSSLSLSLSLPLSFVFVFVFIFILIFVYINICIFHSLPTFLSLSVVFCFLSLYVAPPFCWSWMESLLSTCTGCRLGLGLRPGLLALGALGACSSPWPWPWPWPSWGRCLVWRRGGWVGGRAGGTLDDPQEEEGRKPFSSTTCS